jgi:hypothetical protein
LPSKDELNKLYLQRNIVSGFSNNVFWSSTAFGNAMAWSQNFHDGKQKKEYMNAPLFEYFVRAVRAF